MQYDVALETPFGCVSAADILREHAIRQVPFNDGLDGPLPDFEPLIVDSEPPLPKVLVIGGCPVHLDALMAGLEDKVEVITDYRLALRPLPMWDFPEVFSTKLDPGPNHGWYQQFAGRGGKKPRY